MYIPDELDFEGMKIVGTYVGIKALILFQYIYFCINNNMLKLYFES